MDNLDDALDALYGVAPEEFVSERSRLAKALKQDGHIEDAKAIAAVRKPTVAAWALNQLSRRHRRKTDLLLDVGHRLRTAQAGALAGAKRDEFNRARTAERKAVAELTRKAEELLNDRGSASSPVLNQISQSLRAAAVSVEGRELLARGRFSEPLAAEGFDLISELAGSLPRPAAKPRKTAAREQQRRRINQALRDAKSKLRAAERAAATAKANAEHLASEAMTAGKKASATKDEVEKASQRVHELEEQLRGANRDD
jgi:hypothetical protein